MHHSCIPSDGYSRLRLSWSGLVATHRVACFVDLHFMKVATWWVHQRLAHWGPVITSLFFFFIIISLSHKQSTGRSMRVPAIFLLCHFTCRCSAALWELLIYWPENKPYEWGEEFGTSGNYLSEWKFIILAVSCHCRTLIWTRNAESNLSLCLTISWMVKHE